MKIAIDYKNRIQTHLANYKATVLREQRDGVFRRRSYPHILLSSRKEQNILGPFRTAFWSFHKKEAIELHKAFHHLNSSQAMCFNLFFPLMNEPTMNAALLQQLDIIGEDSVVECTFEKVFKNELWHQGDREGTNFDFFIRLVSGTQLFFELKFSESKFGAAKPDPEHRAKLAKIYGPRLAPLVHPECLTEVYFFEHYQLFRNISYLGDDQNSRLFLIFPRANISLAYAKDVLEAAVLPSIRSRIRIVYLEDLIDGILQSSLCSQPLFQEHYRLFKDKYLPNWSDKPKPLLQ